MTRLEAALNATWIKRLGREKVRELSDGLDAGHTIVEKSKAIVQSSGKSGLGAILLEGFDGYFHQSVYIRRLKKSGTAEEVRRLAKGGDGAGSVAFVELSDTPRREVRALLMARRTLEFLQQSDDRLYRANIPFPVAVSVSGSNIAVRVLTVQCSARMWSEVLNRELRRLLTIVQADALHDQVLDYLSQEGIDVGDYADFSKAAVRLMRRQDVSTYSGTWEVGSVGSARYDTVRGLAKRSLRDSMPKEFEKLTSAERIVNAEIELAASYLNLKAGSRIALYPTVGKIAFRSRLGGCNPDGFIADLVA